MYILAALRLARWTRPLTVLAVAVATAGAATSHVAVTYLPLFFLGALLAVMLNRSEVALSGRRAPWLAGCALIGLTAEWWGRPFVSHAAVLTLPVVILSTFALVFVASRWAGAEALLNARWCQ